MSNDSNTAQSAQSITILLREIEQRKTRPHIENSGNEELCELEERLYHRVEKHFRTVAARLLNRYPAHQSPNVTVVMDDAFLDLLDWRNDKEDQSYTNRRHFVRAAVKTMRHRIIDHFRKLDAEKRRIDKQAMLLSGDIMADLRSGDPAQIVEISDLIDSLSDESPQAMEAIDLWAFGGWTQQEIANLMDLKLSQVETCLRLAKAKIKHACCGD